MRRPCRAGTPPVAGASAVRVLRRVQPRLRMAVGSLRQLTARLIRLSGVVLVVYAGLIGLTGFQFSRAPTGFIPDQDLGYLITVIQLPPGASLERTDAVVRKATEIILGTPGVEHAVPFSGFDGATFTNASNAGAIFSPLKPFEERHAKGQDVGVGAERACASGCRCIQDAFIITIPPPPVSRHRHRRRLQDDAAGPAGPGVRRRWRPRRRIWPRAANQIPGLVGVFTPFSTRTPSVLRRHRPREGAEAGRHAGKGVRGDAGLSRVGLHQRLQLPRPHLSR